jgi:hypothetical protein
VPQDGAAGDAGDRLRLAERQRRAKPARCLLTLIVAQFPIGPPTLIGTGIDPGTAALIDTETAYPRPFRASWTLPPDGTMMCSYPE